MKKRNNLIQARKSKQLTQAEISKQLNVSTRHYRTLEAGTADGSIEIWYKLKQIFDKPIDFLLEQEIEKARQNNTTEKQ